MQKSGIIVICGPTGIGKTGLAIRLAEKFGGEIVSADSMQIYRYMDIGTAKPTAAELARVPHHMIDVADPGQSYDAASYMREARKAVAEIKGRGRVPIVAGGTGFYIKALLCGLCEAKPQDMNVRRNLWREAETIGGQMLYRRLESSDPEAAAGIHPNDTYRVVRALEVYELTGHPMSAYRDQHRFSDSPYEALKFALFMERSELYRRIDRRAELMVEKGLVGEVEELVRKGYGRDLKSMQSLGYRHILDYLEERTDWDTALQTLKRDTRRYAKRQFTWFRKDPETIWVQPEEATGISDRIAEFLKARSG